MTLAHCPIISALILVCRADSYAGAAALRRSFDFTVAGRVSYTWLYTERGNSREHFEFVIVEHE
jgi:hypothetical protein